MNILWWIAFALAIFLTLFSGFKYDQRRGSRRLNDAMTRVGEGSFTTGITQLVLQGFWAIVSLSSMFGIYYTYKHAMGTW